MLVTEDMTNRLSEFLNEKLYNELQRATLEEKALIVDYMALDRFDPIIADNLLEKPESVMKAFRKAAEGMLGEKINSLQIESETLEHLLKKSQADRYVAKTLTKSDYQTRMDQYKNRMTAIKHTLPVVHLRLDKARSYRKYYLARIF